MEVITLGKVSHRKEKATEFIRNNQHKYSKGELVNLIVEKFGYCESSAFNLLRYENIRTCSLREELEDLEKREQKKYEEKLKAEVKNRPKIRINY